MIVHLEETTEMEIEVKTVKWTIVLRISIRITLKNFYKILKGKFPSLPPARVNSRMPTQQTWVESETTTNTFTPLNITPIITRFQLKVELAVHLTLIMVVQATHLIWSKGSKMTLTVTMPTPAIFYRNRWTHLDSVASELQTVLHLVQRTSTATINRLEVSTIIPHRIINTVHRVHHRIKASE